MRKLLTGIAVCLSLSGTAAASDCVAIDQARLGPGPMTNGSVSFTASNANVSLFVGRLAGATVAPAAAVTASAPECAAISKTSIQTHNANIFALVDVPVQKVAITFCDKASGGIANVSAVTHKIEYSGKIEGADGSRLLDSSGKPVEIRVLPLMGNPRAISYSSPGVTVAVLGGAELFIAQICLN